MFAGCALMVFVNGLVQVILPACVILSGMETSVINKKQPQSSLNVIIIIHKKTNKTTSLNRYGQSVYMHAIVRNKPMTSYNNNSLHSSISDEFSAVIVIQK